MRNLPWLKDRTWPRLIPEVREILEGARTLYCIENVPGAPLSAFTLCGQMFGLPIYRHRLFESNFLVMVPSHPRHPEKIGGRLLNSRALDAGTQERSTTTTWDQTTSPTSSGAK